MARMDGLASGSSSVSSAASASAAAVGPYAPLADDSVVFAACMDGHGGSGVAEYLRRHLLARLLQVLGEERAYLQRLHRRRIVSSSVSGPGDKRASEPRPRDASDSRRRRKLLPWEPNYARLLTYVFSALDSEVLRVAAAGPDGAQLPTDAFEDKAKRTQQAEGDTGKELDGSGRDAAHNAGLRVTGDKPLSSHHQSHEQVVIAPTAGACAVMALIHGDALVIANVGDSEAWLCRGGKPYELTCPHLASRDSEYERIMTSGGKVTSWGGQARVAGVLQVSRSIGMLALKQEYSGLVADPFIRVRSSPSQSNMISSPCLSLIFVSALHMPHAVALTAFNHMAASGFFFPSAFKLQVVQLRLPPGTSAAPREEALAAAEKEIKAAHERILAAAAAASAASAYTATAAALVTSTAGSGVAPVGSSEVLDTSLASLRTRSRGARPPLPPSHTSSFPGRSHSGSAYEVTVTAHAHRGGDRDGEGNSSPSSPSEASPPSASAVGDNSGSAARLQPLLLQPALPVGEAIASSDHSDIASVHSGRDSGRESGRDRLDSGSPAPSVRSRRRRASSADTSSALGAASHGVLGGAGPSLSLQAELRYYELYEGRDEPLDPVEAAAAQLAAAAESGSGVSVHYHGLSGSRSPSRAQTPPRSPRTGGSLGSSGASAGASSLAVSRTSSRAPSRLRSVRPATSRAQSPLVRSTANAAGVAGACGGGGSSAILEGATISTTGTEAVAGKAEPGSSSGSTSNPPALSGPSGSPSVPRSAARDLLQRSGALAELALEDASAKDRDSSAPPGSSVAGSTGTGSSSAVCSRPALTIPLPGAGAGGNASASAATAAPALARAGAPPSPMPARPASLLARYAANSEADRRRSGPAAGSGVDTGAGVDAGVANATVATAMRRAKAPQQALEGVPNDGVLPDSCASAAVPTLSASSSAAAAPAVGSSHPLAIARARTSHASAQSLASLASASESESDSSSNRSDSSDDDSMLMGAPASGIEARSKRADHGPAASSGDSDSEGFDEFVVLGSDGLFDAFPNRQELMNRIKAALRETGDVDAACDRIVACAAVERHINDDVSMCLMVLNQGGVATATAGALGGSVGYAKRAGARRIESRSTRFLQKAADLRGRIQRSRSFDASASAAVSADADAAVAAVTAREPDRRPILSGLAAQEPQKQSEAVGKGTNSLMPILESASEAVSASPSTSTGAASATTESQSASSVTTVPLSATPATATLSSTGGAPGIHIAASAGTEPRLGAGSAAGNAAAGVTAAVALPALVAPQQEDGRRALASASVVTAMFPAAGHRAAPFTAAVSLAASTSLGGGPLLARDRPPVHARAATTIATYWSADPRGDAAAAAAALGPGSLQSRTARRAAWTTDAIPTHRTAASFSAALGLPKLEPLKPLHSRT